MGLHGLNLMRPIAATASNVLLLIADNQPLIAPNWLLMNSNRYCTLHLGIEGAVA